MGAISAVSELTDSLGPGFLKGNDSPILLEQVLIKSFRFLDFVHLETEPERTETILMLLLVKLQIAHRKLEKEAPGAHLMNIRRAEQQNVNHQSN